MVTYQRPKVKKYRGSKTHGCGSMKKRRGAGNRGGRGNAGSGKRAHTKQPTRWKRNDYLGRSAFTKKGRVIGRTSLSIHQLELKLENLVADKKATKDGDSFAVDISGLGYDKLVSDGKVTKTLAITAPMASKRAVEKIEAAGGSVTVTNK